MTRWLSASLVVGVSLLAGPAAADIIGPGYKSARSSIQVSGEVPEDSVLILANTFEGATPLEPGKASEVSWHPLHGDMELVLAKRDALPKLKDLPRSKDERWATLRKYTVSCSEPFTGVRTIKISEPYDEVRWYYEATASGEKCSSRRTRTAFLAEGKELSSEPATPSASSATSATPSALPPGTASSSPPNRPAGSGGCDGCATSRSAPASAWLLLPVLLLWWRRVW